MLSVDLELDSLALGNGSKAIVHFNQFNKRKFQRTNRIPMGDKVRVAILDDHQATIDGYLYRLNRDPGIEVVATALYGEEIEPILEQFPVDVLILDIDLKMSPDNPNPFHVHYAISKYLQRYSNLKILVISMHDTPRLIDAVMRSGASGYILKSDSEATKELGSIVRLIAHGGGTYKSDRASKLLQRNEDLTPSLSERETEALSLCAAYPDATLKEVAVRMNVADPTVRNMLANAYRKMGVRTRGAAVAKARYLGLIP